MRGDSGPTVLALAGGFVLTLAFALIAIAVAVSGTPDRDEGLRSYYFRASIEVDGQESDLLHDVLDTLEGWYGGAGRWRWNFGDSERAEAGGIQIADGETMTYYDRETNVYYVQSLADLNGALPPELTNGPPVFVGGIVIGWIPFGDRDRFFQALNADTREVQPGNEVAGRATDVVTLKRGATTQSFWVDRQLPFVLRYELHDPSGPQSLVRVEVTELDLNEGVPEEVFAFEPPEGALKVDAPGSSISGSSSMGGGRSDQVTAPPGFYAPAYVPEGYTVTGMEGSSASVLGGRLTAYAVLLEGNSGFLAIREQYRAGGLAESQKLGEETSVAGVPAYLQSVNGETRLVWAADDIVLTLTSDALDRDELLQVAESMR